MEQFIEFIFRHWVLCSAWIVIALALIFLQLKHLSSGIKSLAPAQVTHLINRENGIVLDIRPIADFNKGHIVGSLNIPQSKVVDSHRELEKYKSTPIIVVCANGIQAGAICQQLKKAGFEMVHKLMGGYQSWVGENLPVAKK